MESFSKEIQDVEKLYQEITGKEMIKFYHSYTKSPSKEKEDLLLQHNYDLLMQWHIRTLQ